MAFIRSRGVRILAVLTALGLVVGLAGVAFIYFSFLRDLPDLQTLDDYRPPVVSQVLDRKGRPIAEFYEERRRLVAVDEIPEHTKQAFVSAEDANFYEHTGVDWIAILRAAYVDILAGGIEQGASTITMQTTKQLLLSPERAFSRKFREMVLARQIEQHLSKQEILYLYLNQIYFGHGAWGIGDAARTYFGKPASELTISESALLAGLPQRPSDYSPFVNPDKAEGRRKYVLGRLFADQKISEAEYEAELANPPTLAEKDDGAMEDALYFAEEVRRYLYDRLGGDTVLREGLVVETTVDLDLQRAAVAAVRQGLEDHDRRRGYRGPVRHISVDAIPDEIATLAVENGLASEGAGSAGTESLAEMLGAAAEMEIGDDWLGVVTTIDTGKQAATVAFAPFVEGRVQLADVEWARKADHESRPQPVRSIDKILAPGDVLRFVRLEQSGLQEIEKKDEREEALAAVDEPWLPPLSIYQRPLAQSALLSIEHGTGDVLALVGGYDYTKSEFNRVTQAYRQPGSAFKPFVYGAAVSRNFTPVATVYDRPAVFEDPVSGFVWRPQNYGRKFYGPMTMRTALARSVNNATVHLFRDIGVDYVIDYARRMGIESPLSRDLSLALGSSGIPLFELTRAYAVYPNRGRRVVPRFINRVTNRDGKVLLEDVPLGTPQPPVLKPLAGAEGGEVDVYPDSEIQPTDQIISEEAAYLMSDLLRAVVDDPRGTGWRLRKFGRPLAGKTGTTNNQADAWFMGFSADVTTGVWVGYDEKRVLGWGETGSRAAAPIWVDFMEVALAGRPVLDFEAPEGIVFRSVDRDTGLLADRETADAYFQPFRTGNEPTRSTTQSVSGDNAARALRNDSF